VHSSLGWHTHIKANEYQKFQVTLHLLEPQRAPAQSCWVVDTHLIYIAHLLLGHRTPRSKSILLPKHLNGQTAHLHKVGRQVHVLRSCPPHRLLIPLVAVVVLPTVWGQLSVTRMRRVLIHRGVRHGGLPCHQVLRAVCAEALHVHEAEGKFRLAMERSAC
jgi:hypothetical protein